MKEIDRLRILIKQVVREQRKIEIFNTVEHDIMLLLNKLTFKEWWEATSLFGADNCQRLYDVFGLTGLASLTTDDLSLDMSKTIELLNLSNGGVEDMITSEIVPFIREPKVLTALKGKKPRMVDSKVKFSIFRLKFWLLFQNHLKLYWLRYKEDTSEKSMETLLKQYEQVKRDIEKSRPLYEKAGKTHILDELHAETINAEYTATGIHKSENPPMSIKFLEMTANNYFRLAGIQKKGHRNSEEMLWSFLNCALLPDYFRRGIVEIIAQSSLKLAAQRSYRDYRMKTPESISLQFFNIGGFEANVVLPKDIKTGFPSDQGMKLDLIREEVIKLYKRLRDGAYIENTTDILDLHFALTGYPATHQFRFRPINWIRGSKQQLAIFLGLLRPQGQEGGWYWNKTTELFLYNGMPFSAKQLSSPFGKFMQHPETRGKDWDVVSGLVDLT